MRRVEAAHGAVECRRLTGLDLDDPASAEEFKTRVHAGVCVPVLRLAVTTAVGLVARPRS